MSKKRISLLEVFLWFIALILILLVASPFVLGFKIKQDYSFMLAEVASLSNAEIKIVSYERNFFSSDVVLSVGIPSTSLKFQFKENIVHGPVYLGLINQGKLPFVIAVASGEMLPVPEFSAQINQLFPGKSAMVYQNIIDLEGNLTSEGYVPAINAVLSAGENKIKINSSGISLKSRFLLRTSKLSGDVIWPAVSVVTGKDTLQLQELTLNYSGEIGHNGLPVGDSVLAIKSMDYYANGDQLSLRSFNIQSISREHDNLLDTQLQMNALQVLASNVELGPLKFNFILNGLDANKLIELQGIQDEMEHKISEGIPSEQVTASYAGQILALLPDLLKQSEILIRPLDINSDIGNLHSELAFSIAGLDASTPADPLYILNSTNLDISVKIDGNLLRQLIMWQLTTTSQGASSAEALDAQINMIIQMLVQQGWLKQMNQQYLSNLSFHQGVMLLNGEEIDPVGYFMSQMAQPAP